MTELFYSHNIGFDEIADRNYEALFNQRRRDSNFAGAIHTGDRIDAFRDHLGIVPLYFRYADGSVRFSNQLSDLVQPSDTLNLQGVRAYTQLSTPRLARLFEEVHIVPPGSVIEIDPVRRQHKTIFCYKIQPQSIPAFVTWHDLVDQFKHLMIRSIEQTVQHDTIGLYLSGGIDSALTGIFLREMGVGIHAYTSGPWGKSSSDVTFAKRNAEIIGIKQHEIHYLETGDYESAMSSLPQLFGIPHGNPTGMGIAKLWENTSISEREQLYVGQNCDTMLGAMRAQYLSYFLQPIPAFIRKRIHPALTHDTVAEDYMHLARNYQCGLSELVIPEIPSHFTRLQQVIMAGMFIVQTPHDSEVFTQASFNQGQRVASPYHNMDLVEFSMGLPFTKRFAFDEGRLPAIEKRVAQRLAARYLPKDVVFRKKAFTVPFHRDQRSKTLYSGLPERIFGLPLVKAHERFGGEILMRWLKDKELV